MTLYSYFKPASTPGTTGGSIRPVSKNIAKRIIKANKMKLVCRKSWQLEKGVRIFSTYPKTLKSKTLTLYTV